MKLKKLLPIAAVASTAAVVAPLVTSCGIASGSFSVHMGSDGKPDKYYEPKVGKKAAGKVYTDNENLQKDYFEDVAKNPKILVDDALYNQFGEYERNVGATGSGTAYVSITVKKFDAEKATFSGKVSLKMDIKGKDSDDPDTTETEQGSLSFDYNDVPVMFQYSTFGKTFSKFEFCFNEDLEATEGWSIKTKGNVKMISENKYGKLIREIVLDDLYDKDNLPTSETIVPPFNVLTFKSYYFSDQKWNV